MEDYVRNQTADSISEVIKNFMMKNKSDAHIIFHTDEHLSEYAMFNFVQRISNFSGSNAILLCILENEKVDLYCFTDGRYFLQAEEELKEFKLMKMGCDTPLSAFLSRRLALKENKYSKITMDMKKASFESFQKIQNEMQTDIEFVHFSNEDFLEQFPPEILYKLELKNNIHVEDQRMIDLETIKMKEVLFIDKIPQIREYIMQILNSIPEEHSIFSSITDYEDKEKFHDSLKQIFEEKNQMTLEELGSCHVALLTYEEKKNLLQSFLQTDHYFLMTDLSNIAWLLNYRVSQDNTHTGNFRSWCLISQKEVILFTDYEIKRQNLIVRSYGEFWSYFDSEIKTQNKDDSNSQTEKKKIFYVEQSHNAYIGSALSKNKKNTKILTDLKAVKNNCEVLGMLQANILDGIALSNLFYHLIHKRTSEMTEEQVSELLFDFKKEAARKYLKNPEWLLQPSFSSIIGSGHSSAVIHYRPQYKKITNDVLLMDTGTQYVFGTTDITRTLHLGDYTKDEKFTKYFTLVLKGQLLGKRLVSHSKCFKSLFADMPRLFLFDEFENYEHGTSHGVGHCNTVHEDLISDRKFSARNIFSLEPGVYFDKEFGIRIEDCMISICKSKSRLDFIASMDLTFVPLQRNLICEELLEKNREIETLNLYNERVRAFLSPFLSDEVKSWIDQQTRLFDSV